MTEEKRYNTFSIGSISTELFQIHQLKIAELLKVFQEENQLPALVCTIDADKNVYHYKNGFMAIDNKIPIQNDSLFESSSITKTFVAVLVIKLAGIGIINIEDNITTYLPEYSYWKNITIKHLLNMTSGIYNFYANEDFRKSMFGETEAIYTPDMLINLSYQEPLKFTPGQQWHYSNTNYLILGKIIEKATGKDINSLLNDYILCPFGLNNTYYSETSYPREIMDRKVHGYYNECDITNVSPSNFGATGSILMNDEDLQKLIKLLFREQIILAQEELKNMFDNVKIPNDGGRLPNSGYGAGIFVTEDEKYSKLIWNVGLGAGYSFSFVYMLKRNIIITMQTNKLHGTDLRVSNHNILFPHGKLFGEIMDLLVETD